MATFGFFLDLVMTVLLGGTIYFTWQLSRNLSRFRSNRAEMERLIRDLNTVVDRSQSAILNLRESAQTAGDELQSSIRSAMELSDELQLVTEAGNNLATRLEMAAGARGDIVPPLRSAPAAAAFSEGPTASPFPSAVHAPVPLSASRARSGGDEVVGGQDRGFSFSIRDPEFDGSVHRDEDAPSVNEDDWGGAEDLRSQAEKDLFKALQMTRKTSRSVM